MSVGPIKGKLSLEQLWQMFNKDGDKVINAEEAKLASGSLFSQFIVEEGMTFDVFNAKNKEIYKLKYENVPMSSEEEIFTEMYEEANKPKKGTSEESIYKEMLEDADKPTRQSERAIYDELINDADKKR